MAYFDPFCPILTGVLFSNCILWWATKAMWRKLSILLGEKFPEFSFGKNQVFDWFSFAQSILRYLQYHFRTEEVCKDRICTSIMSQGWRMSWRVGPTSTSTLSLSRATAGRLILLRRPAIFSDVNSTPGEEQEAKCQIILSGVPRCRNC